jgi:hypothetical protein
MERWFETISRHMPCRLVLIAFLWLCGCVSFYEFEPPAGHPARPEAVSTSPARAPSPYALKLPLLRETESAGGEDAGEGEEKS